MARQRSIFSLILVLLSTFIISCGSPSAAVAPPTYTAAQIEKIQAYIPDIQTVRDRVGELETLIKKSDWIYVGNFIHGPITEAKLNLTFVIPNLLPQDQSAARQITKDFSNHLIKIDQAAKAGNTQLALSNYQAVVTDLDKFLQLVPKASSSSEAS